MPSSSLLFFSLFARALGFFLFSPLFRWQPFPAFLRLSFAFFIALALTPTFFQAPPSLPSPLFAIELLKEVALGYLVGFVFSLLFEAAALAGETIGTMMGLSLTEIFDPLENTSSPLMSRFFALTVALFIFSLDLHHLFIRTFYESFSLLPLHVNPLSSQTLQTIIAASASLFTTMLHFAALPFSLLFLVLGFLALLARFFPDFPIFWLGFPLQLLVGLLSVSAAICFFPEIIESTLLELKNVIYRIYAENSPILTSNAL